MPSLVRITLDNGEIREFSRPWEARRWIEAKSRPHRKKGFVYHYHIDPNDPSGAKILIDGKSSEEFAGEVTRGALRGRGLEIETRDEELVRVNVMLYASQAAFLRTQPNISAYVRKLIDDVNKTSTD